MKQGNVLRKTVAACSAVLLLSVLLFLLLSHAFKLDHPAFYQIYGAYPFFSDNEEEQELFFLPYVNCRGQSQSEAQAIVNFQLREAESLGAAISFRDKAWDTSSNEPGFYTQSSLAVSIKAKSNKMSDNQQSVRLTSASVTFGDGKKQEIPLGEIVLYPSKELESAPLQLISTSKGASQIARYYAEETLRVVSVSCVPKAPDGIVSSLTLNGRSASDSRGLTLKSGRYLEVELVLSGMPEHLTIYEPMVEIVFQKESGEFCREWSYWPSSAIYEEPTFLQIVTNLHDREVIL